MDPDPSTEAKTPSAQQLVGSDRSLAKMVSDHADLYHNWNSRKESRVGTDGHRSARIAGGWSACNGPCSHENREKDHSAPYKRCLSGLWTSDPRKDKLAVDRSISGASSCWILDSDKFRSFLRDDSSRMLWIQTKSPEDNLACVIDELSSLAAPYSPVAYCFCPSYDRQRSAPDDAAVLSGLIYLLVEGYPFLTAWVWREIPGSNLELYPVAFQLQILKRILAHPKVRNVFLVINNLGVSRSGWEQSFLDLISDSAMSGHGKWIVSSGFGLAYKEMKWIGHVFTSSSSSWDRPGGSGGLWQLRLDPNVSQADVFGLNALKWLRYMLETPAIGKTVLESVRESLGSLGRTLHTSEDRKDPETPASLPNPASEKNPETPDTYKPVYEGLVPYDEFRTVLLWGGNETDAIKCTIQRQCIHHPPSFEALSYEWRVAGNSDTETTRFITVNNENFSVGQNLWDALRHLRPSRGDKRRLWIDAICIQQTSDRDRNEQVAIMPLIYSSASTVISWLGATMSDVVKSSMVFLAEIATAGTANITKERAAVPPRYASMLKIMAELPRQRISTAAVARFTTRRREWLDLRAFLALRYWRRLWIVQEVVLSRELRVQCEDCSIDWSTLASFFTWLRYAESDTPQHILDLGRSPASTILSYRIDVRSFPRRDFPPLKEALITFAGTRCSDPRDHVYGLLGIVAGDTAVQPDYSKSTLGLYEAMVAEPRLRTEDQLMSFSQLLQRALGGLFHPLNPMSNAASTDDERQKPGTFYTRARICGNISLIGDAYTTAQKARELLTDWHDLYFHHVKTHRPGDELPSSTKHALLSIQKHAKKAVTIDSRLSYAYVGVGSTTQKPSWDQILRRYEEAASDTPDAVDAENCSGPASDEELCPCLRTERLSSAPRWIIGTRGQIGLVAGAAREGDVICHFENSDVAVIARPFADGWFHSIVGRGLILRQWDEEAARIHDSSPELFTYSLGTERRDFVPFNESVDQMSFHLDLACLRLLSVHSSSDIRHVDGLTAVPRAPMRSHYEGR